MFGLSTKALVVAGGVIIALLVGLGVQTWRVGLVKQELSNERALLQIARQLNKDAKADVSQANKAAQACLDRAAADRERAQDAVLRTIAERQERENALRTNVESMRLALLEAADRCSGPLPDDTDRRLRAGTPYQD